MVPMGPITEPLVILIMEALALTEEEVTTKNLQVQVLHQNTDPLQVRAICELYFSEILVCFNIV